MKKTATYMGHTLAANLLTFVKYIPAITGMDASELFQKTQNKEISQDKLTLYMYICAAVTGDPEIRSMYESKGYDAVEEYLASEVYVDDFGELGKLMNDLYWPKKN